MKKTEKSISLPLWFKIYQYMMIYQVSLFGKMRVYGYNQVKKHKANVTLHFRFSEWVYFVTDEMQCKFGANRPIVWVSLGKNCASLTWEQLSQFYMETILPVSLGNNRENQATFTWEHLCECHLGTIVSVLLRNNHASLTWEQLCQSQLKTIIPVSLGKIQVSLTWEQSHQSHLSTIVEIIGNNNDKKNIDSNNINININTIIILI